MLSKPAYIMGYEPCGETKSEAIMKFSINLSKWKKNAMREAVVRKINTMRSAADSWTDRLKTNRPQKYYQRANEPTDESIRRH